MATGLTLSVQQLQALLDAPASDVGLVVPEPVLTNVPPAASFSIRNIGPPAGYYIGPSEVLTVAIYNSVASATYAFSGRFLRADGTIMSLSDTFAPTSNRQLSSFTVFTGEGFLLSLSLATRVGAVKHGACYARLIVSSSGSGAGIILANLMSGYPSIIAPIYWPGGKPEQPGDGVGVLRTIIGTDPAAGLEVAETVPANARWRLRNLTAALITDATVVTRLSRLLLDDGTNFTALISPSRTQVASRTFTYTATPAGPDPLVEPNEPLWLIPPDAQLAAGGRFRTVTESLQAGDNWNAPQYQVEEWVEA